MGFSPRHRQRVNPEFDTFDSKKSIILYIYS